MSVPYRVIQAQNNLDAVDPSGRMDSVLPTVYAILQIQIQLRASLVLILSSKILRAVRFV
jgi:hypothetical protein